MCSNIGRWVGQTCIALYVIALAACTNFTFSAADQGTTLTITPSTPVELERGAQIELAAIYIYGVTSRAATDVDWTSSDASVAIVSGRRESALLRAVAPGTTTITATGGGLTATIEVVVKTPVVVSLLVAPPQPRVAAGLTAQLTATASMSDGTSMNVTNTATWSSSATSIATVSLGTIHAVVVGDSTITAHYGGQFSSTRVTVLPAVLTAIEVSPTNPLLPRGTPQQFTAMGTFSNGSMSSVTNTVTWASSNTDAATISNAAGTKGLAQTPNAGTTTITATSGTIVGMTTLMVASAALSSIEITPNDPNDVPKSADYPFTATGTFTDGSMNDVTVQATWTSSDTDVATISNSAATEGVADAKSLGSTTITATIGSISDSTQMTVVLAPVGAWTAEAFAGEPCLVDAVKFSLVDSTSAESAYVCTTPTSVPMSGGVTKGVVAANGTVAWASANTSIDNLDGLAIATHRQNANSAGSVMYMATPAASIGNWFRTGDAGGTWTGAAAPLLDSATSPRFLYAGRFQMGAGNMLASWDPTPQAVVVTQQGANAAVSRPVANATGTVRGLAGTNNTNLFAVVLGQTPTGGPATGGVFQASAADWTWNARDAGIDAADHNNLTSIVTADPTATPPNVTHYVGVRGGARVYKSTDNGASWSASAGIGATSIPAKARVSALYVPPGQSTVIYAATDIGLYKSSDAGDHWTLDGFQGRAIRGIGKSELAPSLILVAIDDSEAGDSPLYHHD